MSQVILDEDNRKHLEFLSKQPPQVLQDFCKLTNDYFQKGHNYKLYINAAQLVISLGFIDDKEPLITNLYTSKKPELESSLSNIGFKLPEYHNMEWRFETQIASRSMLKQCDPFVTMDFALKNSDDSQKLQHIILQSDATNLLHVAEELEAALLEGRSQQIRKIKRSVK
ncbi:hypothetical protein G9C98_007900 [Cotesia typhae]|uniref:COMM domain-containing protein n=1 Tax=Cotesia typhae TaxID=2053667 RepID=A0A8J5R9F6_9HYME|nr:hypothetical protein G9C98_007900 [Cotesia typhae]